MTNEEFDHASGIVDETNQLALKILLRLQGRPVELPPSGLWEKLYGVQFDPQKRLAWELACIAAEHHTGEDPDRLQDNLQDELNAQTDPCQAAKEADLAA